MKRPPVMAKLAILVGFAAPSQPKLEPGSRISLFELLTKTPPESILEKSLSIPLETLRERLGLGRKH